MCPSPEHAESACAQSAKMIAIARRRILSCPLQGTEPLAGNYDIMSFHLRQLLVVHSFIAGF